MAKLALTEWLRDESPAAISGREGAGQNGRFFKRFCRHSSLRQAAELKVLDKPLGDKCRASQLPRLTSRYRQRFTAGRVLCDVRWSSTAGELAGIASRHYYRQRIEIRTFPQ